MSSLNEVTLIGHLGSKPELKYTPSGAAYARFSLATNEMWRDRKTSELKTRTDWHRIVVWGRQAGAAAENLDVGRQICVQGALRVRDWKDEQGARRVSTEVHANRIVFLGPNPNAEKAQADENAPELSGDDAPANAEEEIPF
jgi:single-strand DNA-binding protein